MLKDLDDGNWEEVFKYANNPNDVCKHSTTTLKYGREDVKKIVSMIDGIPDEDQWLGLFEMNDGKFLVVRAWCDYTGWGCQEGGSAEVADDLGTLILYGLTLSERAELGIKQL